MMNQISVGVVGSAGYTGGELIRLLIHHPNVVIKFLLSQSNTNKRVDTVHRDLIGETNLYFTDKINLEIDVLFLCLGHGDSKIFLEQNNIPDTIKIIDLSQDFRIQNKIGNKTFVYGLPEANKSVIQKAQNIANPGCFATALQLSLLPIIQNLDVREFYCVGITGSTGAGQSLQASTHFSWRHNNVSAYKSLTHQHVKEIKNNFLQFSSKNISVNFVPWRGDFTKGIFVSSTFKCNESLSSLQQLFVNFYKNAAFTFLSNEPIDLKQILNTNKCVIQIENHENTFVVHAAIDNLLKGASGQALQNMNLLFNLDEKTGLQLKNIGF